MPKHRSYRLLCPITRALDKVGDRWSLLILRDLHAGPARFSDLLTGLNGIASNLLTTRLQQLQDDGLIIKRTANHGVVVYALTEDGERTAPLLFELATLGAQYPAPTDLRRPGNLRTIVVTLKEALRRVVRDDAVHVELIVDDEHFAIDVADGEVSVRYEPYPDAPLAIATEYEALIALGDGDIALSDYTRNHVELQRGSKRAMNDFWRLTARSFGAR
ncbi:winged helix-turn-helix transcriptional regulator [Rhodococcus marinonascens]|uniref:winged helix-turn-helix transcriptional regulator n=1 Tax=Rhodococcus marinonascens TaxID=38311 RepID=UPI00093284A2|nr:helix-turn-helix domain-containing protein [Rhodococcus marinonascens]